MSTVSIIGAGPRESILIANNGSGAAVTVTTDFVRLQSLTITDAADGVTLTAGADYFTLEDCHVQNVTSKGINVQGGITNLRLQDSMFTGSTPATSAAKGVAGNGNLAMATLVNNVTFFRARTGFQVGQVNNPSSSLSFDHCLFDTCASAIVLPQATQTNVTMNNVIIK